MFAPNEPDIPVVICTGYGDMGRAGKAMPPCIKGFLNKPLTMDELARMLRTVLDESEPVQKTRAKPAG